MLVPKLVTTLRGYDRRQFTADVTAGMIVGVVALPLAIAFAIASGVSPERGLYTAIIAGFLISALGGSRVQIGGPTGAFVVIVYSIVQQHGLDGLALAGIMAGVILVVFGVVRLGTAIKFIPHPVTVGFTSGIALIIFSSQIKDLLGLPLETVPPEFLLKWRAYAETVQGVNPWALGVSALTLLILRYWPRVSRRIPGPFVALILTTAIVALADLPVETIGSRFGEIHAGLPSPRLPPISLERITALIGPAFIIALLAAVESLLSAVVADGMIGGRHRSNMELVAQGVANIASPIFGGIPATGAIARTATNVKNGGRTPIAGIVHAITLLVITLFAGRWAAQIPMATLAGILIVVAYHMSEWRTFRGTLRAPAADVAVLLTTFLLTVLIDLTVAIEVGMVLAAFLFMKRMAEVTSVSAITHPAGAPTDRDPLRQVEGVPPDVEIFEIQGPFFFGAAETFRDAVGRITGHPRALILVMEQVPVIDATGMHALQTVIARARGEGTRVIVAGLHRQPLFALRRAGLLGREGVVEWTRTLADAIEASAAPPRPRRRTGEYPIPT